MNLGIFDADNAVPIRMSRRVFATAGTFFYNKPANLIAVDVEVEGGFGAGASGGSAGPGGAGGGYARRFMAASQLPGSVPVVVGAGGASGGTNNPGGNGGASSFGSFLSGTGGGGGGTAGSGTGAGGDLNLTGHSSSGSTYTVGCSQFVFGGGHRPRISPGTGASGPNPGGIASNGTAGCVIVTEYLKGAA